MYADYTYYRDSYCGELSEAVFTKWCREASFMLDGFTNNRAVGYSRDERLQLAACALTDALHRDNARAGLSSEQTDGYAVRYTYPKRCAYLDVASVYLAELGILSRWV